MPRTSKMEVRAPRYLGGYYANTEACTFRFASDSATHIAIACLVGTRSSGLVKGEFHDSERGSCGGRCGRHR